MGKSCIFNLIKWWLLNFLGSACSYIKGILFSCDSNDTIVYESIYPHSSYSCLTTTNWLWRERLETPLVLIFLTTKVDLFTNSSNIIIPTHRNRRTSNIFLEVVQNYPWLKNTSNIIISLFIWKAWFKKYLRQGHFHSIALVYWTVLQV